ncbi:hypothetical protein ACFQZZ_23160 [Nocardia sp. GCM10030253]|uniref:hypothetical protein n=1 Tax=Nocardia sp. GCM10030253 TaxID=3273404 RepID=UPI0036338833
MTSPRTTHRQRCPRRTHQTPCPRIGLGHEADTCAGRSIVVLRAASPAPTGARWGRRQRWAAAAAAIAIADLVIKAWAQAAMDG